jgi:uncharacterized protein
MVLRVSRAREARSRLRHAVVELGEEVTAGTPAAIIHPHDTPWREPAIAAFCRAGTVICKRVPGRVERGDCLFHLADDFVP